MNAQQLKNSILQEAIEGRLVPQDPNDEPASVLLERIRKEKAKLVKVGKLKKKDLEESPISEDEKPFKIPESWVWVRLGQICLVQDIDHKMPEKKNEGIPYISPLDFYGDNGINYTNAKKISRVDFLKLSKKCLPRKGDIIFPRYGTIGAVRLIESEIDFLVSYSCATIKTLIDRSYSKYIYFSLQSPFIQKVEIDKYINKTTQPNVGLQSILKFLLPLPPLAEQKRIVEKIVELLPKVEEYGKAQEALDKLNEELPERLKKSILQEAIEGRLVTQDPNEEPASVLLDKIRAEKKRLVREGKLKKKDLEETPISEDEIPFKIPDSWEWVRLSQVANIIMGQSPDGADVYESDYEDKAFEFHQGKICFTERYISQSGKWCKNPSRLAEKGSLLVCVRAPIGDVNITKRIICIGRGLAAATGYCGINTLFLFFWTLAHKRILEEKGTGSTFKAITIEVLKNQLIPLPPLAEQKRIVEKIEQLMNMINKMKV